MKVNKQDICVIDKVRGQDGWVLAKFFFFLAFLRTETKWRSIKMQKKE